MLRRPPAPPAKLPPLLRSYASASAAHVKVVPILVLRFYHVLPCFTQDVDLISFDLICVGLLDVQITSLVYPTGSDECSIVQQDSTT